MSDEYLWDRSGTPDPEIEHLERTLAPFGWQASARAEKLILPARSYWRWAAAAAVVAAAAGLSLLAIPAARVTPWQVSRIEGPSRVGSRDAEPFMALRAGDVLRTGAASELSLLADPMGQIDLGPNSEMRAASDRRMLLDRGRLHAFIWARPREFVVDTPSARAVDLGCEYTMDVDPSGNGLIRVSLGWVAFQHDGYESFIPAGAECVTRPRRGPGIPFYADAPELFRKYLRAFEEGDASALPTILRTARPEDGLTLWHLLTRVPPGDAAAVYDRFAELVRERGIEPAAKSVQGPDPLAGVSREAVLRRDPKAIDQCWDALDLQNTEWWRGWERRW